MNITCPACSAQFQVDSTRVPSEGMALRCPKCAHNFEHIPAKASAKTLFGRPVGRQAERYFVKRPTGKIFGPFDANAIRMMVEANKLAPQAELSSDQQHWQPLTEVEAFADLAEEPEPRSLFGRPGSGSTILGHREDSAAEEDELELDFDLGFNPDDSSGRGADIPPLPQLKTADSAGANLPRPAAPDLPKPAEEAGLPRPAGLDLPRLKSRLSNINSGAPADLPKRAAQDLPRPSKPDLPRAKPADLPGVPGADLPQRSDAELPRLRGADLFGDDDDDFDLGLGAVDSPQTPTSVRQAPALDDPFATVPGDHSHLLAEASPEHIDLFGAPSDEQDDLFDAPDDQHLTDTGRYEDDLFGEGETGFDMGGALSADEFSDEGFEPTQHQGFDPQTSDDLFSAPGGPDDEDLFAAPGVPDDDDLFAAPGAPADDDLFGDPMQSQLDDDLFEADALLDPEPLQLDDPLDASMDSLSQGDDFLSQDNSFTFLDGASEEESQEIDLAGMSGDWGDDLMSDAPMEEEFVAPSTTAPASTRASSTRAPDPDTARQPASSGIRAQTTRDEAVEQDKKRGSTMLLGAVLAGALVIGGAGYALYTYFSATDTAEAPSAAPAAAAPVAVDLSALQADTYQVLHKLIDQARQGKLSEEDAAKLLLVEALFISRYDDGGISADAEERAKAYQDAEGGWEALARGAWEASQGSADAARSYLEPLLGDSEEVTFWAQLMMGVGDVRALEAHLTPSTPQELPDGPPAPEGAELGDDETEADQPAQDEPGEADNSTDDEPAEDEESGAADEGRPRFDTTAQRLAGRAQDALSAAEKARSGWPITSFWRGHLFELSGEPDQALAAWRSALKASETHVASLTKLGGMLYAQGDLNGAIEPLQTVTEDLSATASDAERGDAHHYLGLIYAARQERDEAIKSLTNALNIDVGRSDTIQALAEQYMNAHKYQEALNFFTTNKDLGAENPDVMLGIVRAHMGLEEWDDATEQLQKGAELFPEDARFPLYLGRLHRERGAFFDARKALSEALEIDPVLLSAHAAQAHLVWLTDKDDELADTHIEVIDQNPALIDAAVGTEVAEYYESTRREEQAERWYQSTLKRFPNYWPARLSLARLYLTRHEDQKALALLERARKEGVKDLQLSAYLADAYRQSGQFDKAIDQINSVLAQKQNSEEYIFIRGRIYFDQGNYDNAERDFNQAYQLDPRFHQAYFFVGRTAFAQDDFGKAMKIFRHVLDYQPNNGEFRYWMGRAYEAENRQTSALNEYRRVTVVDEEYTLKNPEVLVRRGEMLSRQGYVGQGRRDIAQALELAPQMVEARVAMGNLNFREKQYEEAIDHFQRALKRQPELAEVQYRLGMALMYNNQELKGAEHLQLAVRHGYEDPKVYQTLGYLYKRMGKRQQAIDSFKKYLTHIADQKSTAVEAKREMIRQIEELGGRL